MLMTSNPIGQFKACLVQVGLCCLTALPGVPKAYWLVTSLPILATHAAFPVMVMWHMEHLNPGGIGA